MLLSSPVKVGEWARETVAALSQGEPPYRDEFTHPILCFARNLSI